jgi:hypothetical protein
MGAMRRSACLIPFLALTILLASMLACSGQDTITWESPATGSEVFGIVRLEVELSMANGVERVAFYVDAIDAAHRIGELEGNSGVRYELAWFTGETANGPHELIAVGADAAGVEIQAALAVHVENISRADAIPDDAVKMTPELDAYPPQLNPAFSHLWQDPVPLPGPINTAGAEDSPFITPDGLDFYFWFTPDAGVPAQGQVGDRSTGIYWSRKIDGEWSEPVRVYLNYFDEPALDGAHTILGDMMWFASARAGGFREMDMWNATLIEGRWQDWTIVDERLNLEIGIGELHVSADGNRIYFDSRREGGMGEKDIWMTERMDGAWQDPVHIIAVSTEYTEGWPFVNQDETELWFTFGPAAPEVHRSLFVDGQWQAPELILSPFAGEPTLDAAGNLYFVHHYWDPVENRMIEADFYVCYRK